MKLNVLIRKVHNWASVVIALPLIVMIGAGVLLMFKKEIDWIQPPTQKGSAGGVSVRLADVLTAARSVPEAKVDGWRDVDRLDVRPAKGIIKIRAKSKWEIQVDAHTAKILQVAYRRSDLIESIHDGSLFAGWTKHFLFLPTAIVLAVLWMTGLYMFCLPYVKKAGKRRRAGARAFNWRGETRSTGAVESTAALVRKTGVQNPTSAP
jgi:uncharacterized iron-regulated membrane protein